MKRNILMVLLVAVGVDAMLTETAQAAQSTQTTGSTKSKKSRRKNRRNRQSKNRNRNQRNVSRQNRSQRRMQKRGQRRGQMRNQQNTNTYDKKTYAFKNADAAGMRNGNLKGAVKMELDDAQAKKDTKRADFLQRWFTDLENAV